TNKRRTRRLAVQLGNESASGVRVGKKNWIERFRFREEKRNVFPIGRARFGDRSDRRLLFWKSHLQGLQPGDIHRALRGLVEPDGGFASGFTDGRRRSEIVITRDARRCGRGRNRRRLNDSSRSGRDG